MPFFLAMFLAALAIPTFVAHAQDGKGLVKAELLADTTAIVPGKSFNVGIRLTVEPAWHVYWTNPGDAGLPIRVTWKLPEGFTASDLQFPTPIKFVQPGDIVGYGYEQEVMLIATINAPVGVKLTSPVVLSADVKWLVCKDVCIPGKATIALDLPASGDDAKPANQELFKTWTDRVPTANVLAPLVDLSHNAGQIRLDWSSDVTEVQFFPPASDDVTFSDIDVKQAGRTTTITYKAESLDGKPASLSGLNGVVGYIDKDNHRRGIVVPGVKG